MGQPSTGQGSACQMFFAQPLEVAKGGNGLRSLSGDIQPQLPRLRLSLGSDWWFQVMCRFQFRHRGVFWERSEDSESFSTLSP